MNRHVIPLHFDKPLNSLAHVRQANYDKLVKSKANDTNDKTSSRKRINTGRTNVLTQTAPVAVLTQTAPVAVKTLDLPTRMEVDPEKQHEKEGHEEKAHTRTNTGGAELQRKESARTQRERDTDSLSTKLMRVRWEEEGGIVGSSRTVERAERRAWRAFKSLVAKGVERRLDDKDVQIALDTVGLLIQDHTLFSALRALLPENVLPDPLATSQGLGRQLSVKMAISELKDDASFQKFRDAALEVAFLDPARLPLPHRRPAFVDKKDGRHAHPTDMKRREEVINSKKFARPTIDGEGRPLARLRLDEMGHCDPAGITALIHSDRGRFRSNPKRLSISRSVVSARDSLTSAATSVFSIYTQQGFAPYVGNMHRESNEFKDAVVIQQDNPWHGAPEEVFQPSSITKLDPHEPEGDVSADEWRKRRQKELQYTNRLLHVAEHQAQERARAMMDQEKEEALRENKIELLAQHQKRHQEHADGIKPHNLEHEAKRRYQKDRFHLDEEEERERLGPRVERERKYREGIERTREKNEVRYEVNVLHVDMKKHFHTEDPIRGEHKHRNEEDRISGVKGQLGPKDEVEQVSERRHFKQQFERTSSVNDPTKLRAASGQARPRDKMAPERRHLREKDYGSPVTHQKAVVADEESEKDRSKGRPEKRHVRPKNDTDSPIAHRQHQNNGTDSHRQPEDNCTDSSRGHKQAYDCHGGAKKQQHELQDASLKSIAGTAYEHVSGSQTERHMRNRRGLMTSKAPLSARLPLSDGHDAHRAAAPEGEKTKQQIELMTTSF